jgi:hypothetical protein
MLATAGDRATLVSAATVFGIAAVIVAFSRPETTPPTPAG